MVTASWIQALVLGGAVGLGVAIPLGAIGVLLLQTGMTHGWRAAAAGGLGAASVDLAYAVGAVVAGTTVSGLLAGRETVVQLVGAGVLAVVALTGLRGALRGQGSDVAPGPDAVGRLSSAAPGRTMLRFVGLTAVNPLTVVYFTAVAAGLAETLDSTSARVAFVLGIGGASAAWQFLLAAAGAGLGARVSRRVRAVLTVVGYGVVSGFAVLLAVR